jgi:DNA-binding GntR family transcriptional regulator
MAGLQPPPYHSLREMVAERLREAILDGTLRPGQRIMDAEVAAKMGISRSPVREALRQLEVDGLVRSIPNKGTSVRLLSEADLAELYGIRAVLEGLAAAWACEHMSSSGRERLWQLSRDMLALLPFRSEEDRLHFLRLDVEFHQLLVAASRSKQLEVILSGISYQIRMIMAATTTAARALTQSAAEHQQVAEAIAAGDAERAERVARGHVSGALARMLVVLAEDRAIRTQAGNAVDVLSQ